MSGSKSQARKVFLRTLFILSAKGGKTNEESQDAFPKSSRDAKSSFFDSQVPVILDIIIRSAMNYFRHLCPLVPKDRLALALVEFGVLLWGPRTGNSYHIRKRVESQLVSWHLQSTKQRKMHSLAPSRCPVHRSLICLPVLVFISTSRALHVLDPCIATSPFNRSSSSAVQFPVVNPSLSTFFSFGLVALRGEVALVRGGEADLGTCCFGERRSRFMARARSGEKSQRRWGCTARGPCAEVGRAQLN